MDNSANKGGRPKIGEKREVRLGEAHWRLAKAIGKGNASAGIREALDLIAQVGSTRSNS